MLRLSALFLIATTHSVFAQQFRIGATLGSYHIGGYASEFNQVNLGATIGLTFQPDARFQYGLQAGIYNNSYSERTTFITAFADYRAFRIGSAEIRAGAFVGLFEYPAIAARAKAIGWPTVGDYVLAIGPMVKLRNSRGVDFTIGYLPIKSRRVRGVLTLSMSVPFGAGL